VIHVGKHTPKIRKGIVGIEAAIILIAFVIISAAFAFMVINMGLFATQRSKDTISQGLREASSPLQVDGNIFIRVNSSLTVNATIIPLRAMGVKYVPVGKNETCSLIKYNQERRVKYSVFKHILWGKHNIQPERE
jgi:flagellin-like protein